MAAILFACFRNPCRMPAPSGTLLRGWSGYMSEQSKQLTYSALKERHRALRAGFPNDLSLRVHRSLSWLQRAEHADDDNDIAFICYWIAFNAAYANDLHEAEDIGERDVFSSYFGKLCALDDASRIYNAIWHKFPQSIRLLLDNRYVFQPFWSHHNGLAGYSDWENRFDASKARARLALQKQDTQTILSILFDRLYVLRNQIVHGGATWNSVVNRQQVGDGRRILAEVVPIFVDLMMAAPDTDWGAPYYPVVDA